MLRLRTAALRWQREMPGRASPTQLGDALSAAGCYKGRMNRAGGALELPRGDSRQREPDSDYMKPTLLLNHTHGIAAALTRSLILALLTILLALGAASGLRAADVTWTGGGSHRAGTVYWTTTTNWDTATVPTVLDNAILGTGGSTNAYIDFAGTTPVSVGCITLSSDLTAHNQILRQPGGIAPVCVYGVGGVLVTNASTVKRLQIAQNGVTAPVLYLAGNGTIGVG